MFRHLQLDVNAPDTISSTNNPTTPIEGEIIPEDADHYKDPDFDREWDNLGEEEQDLGKPTKIDINNEDDWKEV